MHKVLLRIRRQRIAQLERLGCTEKQMRSTGPFTAFQRSRKRMPIIAVDIGYSAKARSCGIAWSGHESPICLHFGNAVRKVADLYVTLEQPVLVVEAALSTFHQPNDNPDLRGSFEEGRGWYWGLVLFPSLQPLVSCELLPGFCRRASRFPLLKHSFQTSRNGQSTPLTPRR
ncbi:MAG: hypothetical protein ACREVE_12290 [Gammaproteobacteria bacterium]